ncbi:hypothetical protein IQ06DRAFT_23331 [Phaeosphaeriaceae sp. SRC1lsM3a]|nr:hypothetical protein IQ06DRAFT_23331 [Stagonospora sp. SRC1lsM3a]
MCVSHFFGAGEFCGQSSFVASLTAISYSHTASPLPTHRMPQYSPNPTQFPLSLVLHNGATRPPPTPLPKCSLTLFCEIPVERYPGLPPCRLPSASINSDTQGQGSRV